ncbi:hypothetical protein [Alistipes putredinis]
MKKNKFNERRKSYHQYAFFINGSDSVVENRTAAFPEEGRRSHRNG